MHSRDAARPGNPNAGQATPRPRYEARINGVALKPGEIVKTFRGETRIYSGCSERRVFLMHSSGEAAREYFPGVINAEIVPL